MTDKKTTKTKSADAPKPGVTPPKYLTNKQLLPAVIRAKEKGELTDELARMLQLLCKRYARHPKFVRYSYSDDMQAFAMCSLVRTWKGFDPNRSETPNPFAFFTQCIKNSYKQYIKTEKTQTRTKDELAISQGLNPSYGYQSSYNEPNLEDEQDWEQSSAAIYEHLSGTSTKDDDLDTDDTETGIDIDPTMDGDGSDLSDLDNDDDDDDDEKTA